MAIPMDVTEVTPTRTTTARVTQEMEGKSGYSLLGLEVLSDSSRVVFRKHVPEQILTRFLAAAVGRAESRPLDDGTYFAEIPGFAGPWAHEATLRDTLNVLHEVLLDWVLLKVESEDRDIPVIADIDLNDL